MARRTEYTAHYPHPAAKVYEAFSSEQYWKDRIEKIGGKNASVVSFAADDSGIRIELRQFIERAGLPSVAQKVVKNDMVISRIEKWGPFDGTATGESDAQMEGRPKDGIFTTFTLRQQGETAAQDCKIEARVGVPIVGGQLEKMLLASMEDLIKNEAEWTSEWITENL
jgi:hypothetical protein